MYQERSLPLDYIYDSFTERKRQDFTTIESNVGTAFTATLTAASVSSEPALMLAACGLSAISLGRAAFLAKKYVEKNREFYDKYPALKELEDQAKRRAKFKNHRFF